MASLIKYFIVICMLAAMGSCVLKEAELESLSEKQLRAKLPAETGIVADFSGPNGVLKGTVQSEASIAQAEEVIRKNVPGFRKLKNKLTLAGAELKPVELTTSGNETASSAGGVKSGTVAGTAATGAVAAKLAQGGTEINPAKTKGPAKGIAQVKSGPEVKAPKVEAKSSDAELKAPAIVGKESKPAPATKPAPAAKPAPKKAVAEAKPKKPAVKESEPVSKEPKPAEIAKTVKPAPAAKPAPAVKPSPADKPAAKKEVAEAKSKKPAVKESEPAVKEPKPAEIAKAVKLAPAVKPAPSVKPAPAAKPVPKKEVAEAKPKKPAMKEPEPAVKPSVAAKPAAKDPKPAAPIQLAKLPEDAAEKVKPAQASKPAPSAKPAIVVPAVKGARAPEVLPEVDGGIRQKGLVAPTKGPSPLTIIVTGDKIQAPVKKQLSRIGSYVAKQDDKKVRIIGYTSDDDEQYNAVSATVREVYKYMTGEAGVPKDRVKFSIAEEEGLDQGEVLIKSEWLYP